MIGASPTQISKFINNCPFALKQYREAKLLRESVKIGDERLEGESLAELEIEGPEAAERGIVFHSCAHAAALAEKKDQPRESAIAATALALTRKFNPQRVAEGADQAREFIFWFEFAKEFDYEFGVAFGEKWNRLDWNDPSYMLRLIMDAQGVMQIDDPQYGEVAMAIGQDYKSGWGASEEELDSVQALAYTTALNLMYGDKIEAIRMEIIATRFNRTFARTWFLSNEEDVADLYKRKQRLEFYLKAIDISDFKPRLGLGCATCSYTGACAAFQERIQRQKALFVLGSADIVTDPAEAAKDMVICKTRAKELEVALKEITKGKQLEVNGSVLGYHPKKKRTVKDEAAVVELWFKAAGNIESVEDAKGVFRGLIKTVGVGVTAMDAIIRKVAPQLGYATKKQALEELSKELCEERMDPQFGWIDKV
jgi:hypothetical protein